MAHLFHNAPMKQPKTAEIKARVDEVTKTRLVELAEKRHLDTSDLIREAIRRLIDPPPARRMRHHTFA